MNLNKKGFTLVELLAVIVILALLIVIVANTAIPAMNNAKKKSLQTYAQKVVQKAKENCAAEKMADMGNMCGTKSCCSQPLAVEDIMGEKNDPYTASITVTYNTSNSTTTVVGWVQDKDNKIADVNDIKTITAVSGS